MRDWKLVTGANIPFVESIYLSQPTMKELSQTFSGEDEFLKMIQLLNHNKDSLKRAIGEDVPLDNDYLVFLSLLRTGMMNGDLELENKLLKFLKLLFKDFNVEFSESGISVSNSKDVFVFIDENNYGKLQAIIREIFCLKDLIGDQEIITDYNPQGERAKQIAEKLKKRHNVLSEMEKESSGKSVFANYIDIVSVDLGVSINEISNYTLSQLMIAMQRLNLLEAFNIDLKVRLAGGDPKSETEHWKKII